MIGIVSAKLSSSSNSEASVEGLGFAIPINDVKDMVTSIIEHGYVTGKPNVGILMKDVPQEAQQYGVPAGSEVLAVLDGSGAGKAGLQAGGYYHRCQRHCSVGQRGPQSRRPGL